MAANDLSKIKIDSTVYELKDATARELVKANQADVPSESLFAITVNGTTYSVGGSYSDADVKTLLSSGDVQAIDLDPNSSHVISQVVTATESYLGPTYLLYTIDKETGQLDPTNHGGLFYETEGLDNPIVAVMNQDEDGQIALGSYAERPIYYNADSQTFTDIALTTDFTGTAIDGAWTSLTINGVTADIPTGGGGGGGKIYRSGNGITVDNTANTISIDEDVVAQKSDLETLQPRLTAGANIVINEDNVISAVSGEEGMPPFPAKDPTKQYMLGLIDDPDTGLYKLAWVFIVNVDEESY